MQVDAIIPAILISFNNILFRFPISVIMLNQDYYQVKANIILFLTYCSSYKKILIVFFKCIIILCLENTKVCSSMRQTNQVAIFEISFNIIYLTCHVHLSCIVPFINAKVFTSLKVNIFVNESILVLFNNYIYISRL